MAYFKYVPYFFLLVAAIFVYDAVMRYTDGADPLPSVLLALAAVAMFFIRRRSYKRYTGQNNHPKK
jgi:MYXO-CTERM domain-containing protein